jgi:hypothetical protein
MSINEHFTTGDPARSTYPDLDPIDITTVMNAA